MWHMTIPNKVSKVNYNSQKVVLCFCPSPGELTCIFIVSSITHAVTTICPPFLTLHRHNISYFPREMVNLVLTKNLEIPWGRTSEVHIMSNSDQAIGFNWYFSGLFRNWLYVSFNARNGPLKTNGVSVYCIYKCNVTSWKTPKEEE